MKLPVHLNPNGGKGRGRIAFQGGSYALAISAIVLALLVVVNVLVSILPTSLTRFDISSSQLYSITSNTKSVVNALEEDVTIYWIVQADEEDPIVENLLDKYDSLSGHISVVKKNPDVYPTFTQQYTDETVTNNSLIVECGDKSCYISYSDIYLYETDFYSYGYTSASFDGEGAITSAIDYVVSDELPQLYLLEGHGEAELPQTFQEQLEKDNIETQPLIDENYYPIVPVATGLTVSGSASGATVTELLTTSDSAFSKVSGYEMTTYDEEEGDMDGPFAVAVSVERNDGGEMVWFSSSLFLDDGYNAYSSGANVNLTMNALSQLIGEREAMSIRSKSLNYNYLTINESTASLLKVTMIGVFPLIYLAVGIGVVVKRRRMQHEPV
ncbi:DUF7088 domain-containing protein [Flavonifractor sp. An9]|uniref:DUF7088 domain-containing protein n=1 Tax=Flavonifractor sp. An9 TaxID=1965664 RepID=UPI000B36FC24|nr:Gldg family protein [Flavonifractor sp. An9]OUN09882.1 hypothetical protein B5G40_11140 [Flavonifractor sp. An9]